MIGDQEYWLEIDDTQGLNMDPAPLDLIESRNWHGCIIVYNSQDSEGFREVVESLQSRLPKNTVFALFSSIPTSSSDGPIEEILRDLVQSNGWEFYDEQQMEGQECYKNVFTRVVARVVWDRKEHSQSSLFTQCSAQSAISPGDLDSAQ